MVDLVGWIAAGGLAGVTGELIMPGRTPGGITVALLIGMAGALLGRFIVGLLGGAEATELGIWTIVWGTLGALALLGVYRLATNLRGT
jgi:uncharacterized membrane protein YeaQ/YmgE (transglycosylase-associated protein family)